MKINHPVPYPLWIDNVRHATCAHSDHWLQPIDPDVDSCDMPFGDGRRCTLPGNHDGGCNPAVAA